MKLNLGCGPDIKEGFINIDIRDLPGVDLIADIKKLYSFENNSVDEINAYDVLEHFPFHQTVGILTNWISKLKSDGKIIVRVPDMEKIFRAFSFKTLSAYQVQELLYGGQDYSENFHYAGFTEGLLEGLLLGCGCSRIVQVVREDDSYNVTLVAIK